MIVIKIGGSLAKANTLRHCLCRIAEQYQGRDVVIVMGGGDFAEQVRVAQQVWQFDDYTAHAMALLAMQQMAWLAKGLQVDFVLADSVNAIRKQCGQNIVIWSPDLQELDKAGLAATWNVTSDSLAAWLANTLLADELILIKSAVIEPQLTLAQLTEHGIIDRAFCDAVANSTFSLRILNQQNFSSSKH